MVKATAVAYTDSIKCSGKAGYILSILHDTLEKAKKFQDQTTNASFQNSIKVLFRI